MTATAEPTTATFESLDPATGDVIDVHPDLGPEEVAAQVERAREGAAWWSTLSFDERREYLLTWGAVITRRIAQLADLSHRETGKPHGDALLEIAIAIDHIAWSAKHAKKVLGPQSVSPGLVMANVAASVEYRPLGVVGVIGPWNYPVFTPLGSAAYALAAGNAVVFKPSEYTPGVGVWLTETFAEVVGRDDVFIPVTGLGKTGAALAGGAVDKVAFTGSTATGKKVMAAAAKNLTPVLIEAGGKDALLVDEDADLAAAADAALWAGMANAGQTCIGTERVYVHEAVYDDFVRILTDQARGLRAGGDPAAQIGPITMPSQLKVIAKHIKDAVARGGEVLLGGPEAVGERFVQPTIIANVAEDSSAVREETFGPTLVVNKVRDMDEAIARTNATDYALAGAVFSKARGMELARRMRSGMASINAVISFAAVPSLPFGGVGQSGFGRIHGPDGLKEFTYAKSIARQRFRPPLALTTFTRDAETESKLVAILNVLHGGKSTFRS